MVRLLRRLPAVPGPALTLHERLEPLSFLLGEWRGFGVVGYPTMTERQFEQEISFTSDGRPFLLYRAQSWLLDPAVAHHRSGPPGARLAAR